jgi:predicted nucleic-acid-binding Zn-ribbon protein
MNATLDLTLATDPRGTCPQCRTHALHYEEMPFAGNGLRPTYHPAVHCRHCNYTQRIEPSQRVLGAIGTPTA